VRSLRTVFSVYALSSSSLFLLTCLQAEISGQDQDGCNTEPNFHGIHQVCATANPSFLSHPSFSSPTCTRTCISSYVSTTYHPTISRCSYHHHISAEKPVPLAV
jgi:hypothetical protein